MMAFGGYDMPVQYSGIKDEHLAVRNAVGVFDVSHMGEFVVKGPNAGRFVQQLVTNDIAKLYDGRAMYTVMCNEDGGIVDDLLVYRLDDEEYLLVVNAANIEKDFDWVTSHNDLGADLHNRSDDFALLAVQGPLSKDVVQKLTRTDLDELRFYHLVMTREGGILPAGSVIARTGYTGELGYELYIRARHAETVWNAIFDAGADIPAKPVGLGARDTLRMEAGYCLYGNDITEATNPFEAGLGWVTKLDKGHFIGSGGAETCERIRNDTTTGRLCHGGSRNPKERIPDSG